MLQAEEKHGALELAFDYRSSLFREETVAEMADELLKLLEKVAASPSESLGKLTGIDELHESTNTEDTLFGSGFQF
ncbi:condensation domain-containing protein [Cohnella cholangitidis]|uniref:condensation domain-containing protein n=1 Tax=Cohnella cholangitidis TaxID=2598458 RepID=UPI0015FC3322|nr:condensation domain-containing protein [Cohnella cholangitidis]